MTDFKLIHGIYESVITRALEERLNRISDSFDVEKNQLDSEESSFALALHLTKLIANSLASIKGDDKKQRQAQFCNQLLEVIGQNDSSFPRGREVSAGNQYRCFHGDAEQIREAVFAHDHVSGLRHQRRAFPLAVAEHHQRGIAHRSALYKRNQHDPTFCPREQKRRRGQFQLLLPRSGGLRFPQRITSDQRDLASALQDASAPLPNDRTHGDSVK